MKFKFIWWSSILFGKSAGTETSYLSFGSVNPIIITIIVVIIFGEFNS